MSVLPVNIQGWFPLGLTGLISLQCKGLSRVFSNTTVQKHQFLGAEFYSWSNCHILTTTGKTIALTRWTFVGKIISVRFNLLSRFVIAFLPRSKHLLISWLQSSSAVLLESKKIKSVTISIVSPSTCHHSWASPEWVIQEEARRKSQYLLWHSMEVIRLHLFVMLCLWGKSLSPVTP